jgi:hypothetical protein
MSFSGSRASRGFLSNCSIRLLCAGLARLLAGALRERTKLQKRVKRKEFGNAR